MLQWSSITFALPDRNFLTVLSSFLVTGKEYVENVGLIVDNADKFACFKNV